MNGSSRRHCGPGPADQVEWSISQYGRKWFPTNHVRQLEVSRQKGDEKEKCREDIDGVLQFIPDTEGWAMNGDSMVLYSGDGLSLLLLLLLFIKASVAGE